MSAALRPGADAVWRRRVSAFLFFLALLCLGGRIAADLAADPGFLENQFRRFSQVSEKELPPGGYATLAAALGGYLAGVLPDPAPGVPADEAPARPYGSRELEHLRDVRQLVVAGKRLLYAGAALVLAAALMIRGAGRRPPLHWRAALARSAAGGLGGLLLAAVGLSLWGMLDFEGLFLAFHRMAFRNELWMLDPERDLLLRLMPARFFADSAAVLGRRVVVLVSAAALAALAAARPAGAGKGRKA